MVGGLMNQSERDEGAKDAAMKAAADAKTTAARKRCPHVLATAGNAAAGDRKLVVGIGEVGGERFSAAGIFETNWNGGYWPKKRQEQ